MAMIKAISIGATSANSTATAPRSSFLDLLWLRFNGSPWTLQLEVGVVCRAYWRGTPFEPELPAAHRGGEAGEEGIQVGTEGGHTRNDHERDQTH